MSYTYTRLQYNHPSEYPSSVHQTSLANSGPKIKRTSLVTLQYQIPQIRSQLTGHQPGWLPACGAARETLLRRRGSQGNTIRSTDSLICREVLRRSTTLLWGAGQYNRGCRHAPIIVSDWETSPAIHRQTYHIGHFNDVNCGDKKLLGLQDILDSYGRFYGH